MNYPISYETWNMKLNKKSSYVPSWVLLLSCLTTLLPSYPNYCPGKAKQTELGFARSGHSVTKRWHTQPDGGSIYCVMTIYLLPLPGWCSNQQSWCLMWYLGDHKHSANNEVSAQYVGCSTRETVTWCLHPELRSLLRASLGCYQHRGLPDDTSGYSLLWYGAHLPH